MNQQARAPYHLSLQLLVPLMVMITPLHRHQQQQMCQNQQRLVYLSLWS
jgi:hypothetical protein